VTRDEFIRAACEHLPWDEIQASSVYDRLDVPETPSIRAAKQIFRALFNGLEGPDLEKELLAVFAELAKWEERH
jgi:hypothetical protein